jgi:hypothetical protein
MKMRIAIGAAALLLVTSSTASAAPITFATRAGFDAQAGILPIETFEEGVVAPGGVVACPGFLASTTINACFSAGDILPGITLTSSTVSPSGLALTGAGFSGVPSKAVFANLGGDTLDLRFASSNAIGLDLHSILVDSPIAITVFGEGDVVLDVFVVLATAGGRFWGIIGDGPITRLNLSSLGGTHQGVDNVAFGVAAATVPEPASLTLRGAGPLGAARARPRARN